MPTYNYICSNCKHEFSTVRSIKLPILKRCPKCNKHTLNTIIGLVTIIDLTPKTLGSLADQNHQRAGNYERESKLEDSKIARQNVREGREAWWRPGETYVKPDLVRSNVDDKKKYLEEGIL